MPVLPDTKEALLEQYNLSLVDDPPPLRHEDALTQHEMHFSILHNVIHVRLKKINLRFRDAQSCSVTDR